MAGAAETPEEQRGIQAANLEAASSGDLAAFEMLMRQHERLVLVTALRLTGNLADAQDVSQEVFLKLYRILRWSSPRIFRRTGWIRSRRRPRRRGGACSQ
jgi:RNA polymerase sigma-70 factor (ECF subfamily)